jgi:hypothetical protein
MRLDVNTDAQRALAFHALAEARVVSRTDRKRKRQPSATPVNTIPPRVPTARLPVGATAIIRGPATDREMGVATCERIRGKGSPRPAAAHECSPSIPIVPRCRAGRSLSGKAIPRNGWRVALIGRLRRRQSDRAGARWGDNESSSPAGLSGSPRGRDARRARACQRSPVSAGFERARVADRREAAGQFQVNVTVAPGASVYGMYLPSQATWKSWAAAELL